MLENVYKTRNLGYTCAIKYLIPDRQIENVTPLKGVREIHVGLNPTSGISMRRVARVVIMGRS